MSEEYFYAATLTGDKKTIAWDCAPNGDEEYQQAQKLVVKQVLLGAEAKEGEFNVVTVETIKGSLSIPIAVLKAGETRAVNPDIEFFETDLKFVLTSGNGPVYIHGQCVKDDVMDELEEETEEEEDEEEEDVKHKAKKAKLDNNKAAGDGKNPKNKKK